MIKRTFKKLNKKIFIGLLIGPIFLMQFTGVVKGEVRNDITDNLTEATALLQYLLQEEYDDAIDAIKQECIDENLDIETSIESIGQKDSIFADVNYVDLMSAYITIANNDLTIHDIEFITYTKEIESFEYIVPVKTYELIEDENGNVTKGKVVYITKEGNYDIVTENEDGSLNIENKHIVPEVEDISYGNYTLHLITKEELLATYGDTDTDNEEALEVLIAECDKRAELMTASGINLNGLSESIMIQLQMSTEIEEGAKTALENALANSDPNMVALITNASSLIGRVPYLWGGKPTKAGYDNTWFTINSEGKQKGLDCSGFVAWAFLSSGYSDWQNLYSTSQILSSQQEISKDELQIGDLGLLNRGESVNHVGIYIGDGYFIHCSSAKNTVTISKFPFTVFKRVNNITTLSVCDSLYMQGVELTEEQIYTLAQLVSHEAKGQGLNGWIAVTEVVMNRINSPLYPNSLEEVIYQSGQFQDVEDIIYETPTENLLAAVKQTVSGNISVLNDANILYFRNPPSGVSDTDMWGDLEPVVTINDHVFYRSIYAN